MLATSTNLDARKMAQSGEAQQVRSWEPPVTVTCFRSAQNERTLSHDLSRVEQMVGRVSQKRGMVKLMLRLPQLREAIKLAHLRQPAIDSLLEAYDDASDALEQMQALADPDEELLQEYRQICREIESEIAEICRAGN